MILFHLVSCELSSNRNIRSVHFKELPSKKNHRLVELQIVQTVLVVLHCEQNGIITAKPCPSSWNYSVAEGCGWAIIEMTNGVNCTADNAC